MTKYTLISFKLCPYVQRVAIALREKGISFDLVYVDLAEKPDWFRAISPLGKVPLLKVEEGDQSTILFESSVILEYLEDIGVGRPMHPTDPVERAVSRGWMEFGSSLLGDIWALETATERPSFEAAVDRIKRKLETLEAVMSSGPYFGGYHPSFVDAVFAPAFRYFDVFDRYLETPLLDQFPKIAAWRRQLRLRPSVRDAVAPEYEEHLEAFLRSKEAWLVRQHQRVQVDKRTGMLPA